MTNSLIYLAAAAVMVLVVSRVTPAGRSFTVALLAVIALYALLVVTPSGPAAVEQCLKPVDPPGRVRA
jgi:hypothetical protein